MELGERPDVRHPPRLGRQRVDVESEGRDNGPDVVEFGLRPSSPYKGKITAYDSPIYIADAALYLEKTQPNLKITNPYALDQTQFNAAIAVLKAMKANWSRPWSAYTDEVQDFESGATAIGTAWQINANLINGDKKVPSTRRCRPRARPGGPTPGWSRRRRSTRTACTSG